ncbi:MAG: hypothetical protein QM726_18220 [Chitinophagaceae bacterium]
MAIQAVLTADIVNSTGLGRVAEKKMIKSLRLLLQEQQFEFYRGDSFQVYVKEAGAALRLALLCRTAAIYIAEAEAEVSSDIRISIGIGTVKMPVTTPGTGKGDAFVLSGRAFDELAINDTRLAIASNNILAGLGLQVIADYINAIFKNMTGKQAVVIFELLKGGTQQTVAAKLKKSKSTVHQHVTAGRWPEIEKLLLQYENIIHQLS